MVSKQTSRSPTTASLASPEIPKHGAAFLRCCYLSRQGKRVSQRSKATGAMAPRTRSKSKSVWELPLLASPRWRIRPNDVRLKSDRPARMTI